MAGNGPPPKPAGQRRHRPAKGKEPPRRSLKAAPTTPPALPGASGYLEATRRWYATWATSPQASRFLATDWQRLAMLAALVDAYYAKPDRALLAEIRLNEASLGATEADRLRLRWDVALPTDQAPAAAPEAPARDARRARILEVIDGGTPA